MYNLISKFFRNKKHEKSNFKFELAILDPNYMDKLDMYHQVCKTLEKEGIRVNLHKGRRYADNRNSIFLLATSMHENFKEEERVLGQRILNRKERLELIGEMNSEIIPKWVSPTTQEEFLAVAKKWNTKEVILKYDWSAGRRGVYCLSEALENFVLPEKFDPNADIIMEHLEEDPYTYKVELLSGVVLNAWVLKTTNIKDENFNEYTPQPSLFKLPKETADALKEISLKLLEYGIGYSSYDMMKQDGKLKLIEINTNSVGTNIAWSNFFDQYAANYPNAILNTIKHIDIVPSLKVRSQRVKAWRNRKAFKNMD